MCLPRYIFDLLPLLQISVSSENSVLRSPRTLAHKITLRSNLPRNLTQKTPFKSVPSALFHFPYPLSPLFATLTKTAGCIPTIPILELIPRHSSLSTAFKFFLFMLFRTLLRAPKTQLLSFQAIPHSLRKTPGVGGTPSLSTFKPANIPTLPHPSHCSPRVLVQQLAKAREIFTHRGNNSAPPGV